MLDSYLAEIYGIETRPLNQGVKRNSTRFPEDFMFQPTENELIELRSQIVTSNDYNLGRGGNRYLPFVFTQNGIAMLSSVLKSERAIQMNVFIMRQFAAMQQIMLDNKDVFVKIMKMEQTLTAHDDKLQILFKYIKQLIEEKERPIELPREPIGFKLPTI